MTEDIGYIEPVLLIKPEKFSIENIDQYELSIEIGATYFRFAIKNNGEFICLEDFQYPSSHSKTQFIEKLFNEHPYLSARFWKSIKVILHSTRKTVIPCEINPDQASEAWTTLYGEPNDGTGILFTRIGENSVIFQTETQILDFLFSFYNKKKINIKLAESLLPFTDKQETYLLFDGTGCHITYSSPQLNCYYTSDWKKRDLSGNYQNVHLIGEITEYATEFKQLINKIQQAKKAELEPKIRLSNNFGQIAKYRYFIIFNS